VIRLTDRNLSPGRHARNWPVRCRSVTSSL
jgi:hypothetical protein